MSKVIEMPKSKKQRAHELASKILRNHKDALINLMDAGETDMVKATQDLSKQYKRSIAVLQQQYPKFIHGGHFSAFDTDTAELMNGYIMSSAWSHVKKYAVAILVFLLTVAAMYGLWNI